MKTVQNIFKENNYSLKEFYSNGAIEKDTDRLKIEFINENEIILDVNMIGKKLPTYLEATFYFPQKVSGNLLFFYHAVVIKQLYFTIKTAFLLFYVHKNAWSLCEHFFLHEKSKIAPPCRSFSKTPFSESCWVFSDQMI